MVITTIAQQRQLGRAARRVGGYSNLVKLQAQRDAIKGPSKLVEKPDGTFEYQPLQLYPLMPEPELDLAPFEMIVAGDELIPMNRIRRITLMDQEGERVIVRTDDGDFEARGQDALSIVLSLKPSSLEGRRRRWKKGSWAYHNLVGHPVMQILAWLGYGKAAVRFHDRTIPDPR
jgi:hypothetical protein